MEEEGDDDRIPTPPPLRLLYSLPAGDADLPLLVLLPLLLGLEEPDGRMKRLPNCCPPVDDARPLEEAEEEAAEEGRSNMGLGWRPLPEAWMLKAPVLPPCMAVFVSRLEEEAVPSM